MSGHTSSRRGTGRRAADRPAWNKVYEDLLDEGYRPARKLQVDPDLSPDRFRCQPIARYAWVRGWVDAPRIRLQHRCLAVIRGQPQVRRLPRWGRRTYMFSRPPVLSDRVCYIGHLMPLLLMAMCEGVLLMLSNPVEHPSESGWIPWYPLCGKPFHPEP